MTRKIASKVKVRNRAQLFFKSHVYGRVQDGALPSSWRSAARLFFQQKGQSLVDFIPMSSPRGISAIIMEIGRSSIFSYKVCPRAQPSFPRSWRAQEGALSSSWRLTTSRFIHFRDHGKSKRELCHHHGISQKNPFDLVIYLLACLSSLYI